MKKRHSSEQIVGYLRQADVLLGKGTKVPEVCKQLGISEQTYYRWRTKYGGWILRWLVNCKSCRKRMRGSSVW
jgi:transposase